MKRIREAVIRITKTDLTHVRNLPVLEQSLLPLLAVASTFYMLASQMRGFMYRCRVFNSTRLSVPVVSVGNITWGGNGKTPMVEYLSSCFICAGIRPLILSRGYGKGDEVRLLESHLKDAIVGVGTNRTKVARLLLQEHGLMPGAKRKNLAETIDVNAHITAPEQHLKGYEGFGVAILDDGMQHWGLARDLEVVMINVVTLWGNESMVPLGPLREPLEALYRADVLILHHADLVSEKRIQEVKCMLRRLVDRRSVMMCSRMAPRYFFRIRNQEGTIAREVIPLAAIEGTISLSVSGIGCPESVSMVLEQDLYSIRSKLVELQHKFVGMNVVLIFTEKDYSRDPVMLCKLQAVEPLILHSSLEILGNSEQKQALNSVLSAIVRGNDKLRKG